jgi:hypothetical protein
MGSGTAILAPRCVNQHQRRPGHTRSRNLLGELYATFASFALQPERQPLSSTDSGCARHLVGSHENCSLRGTMLRPECESMLQKKEPTSLDLRGEI